MIFSDFIFAGTLRVNKINSMGIPQPIPWNQTSDVQCGAT